MAEADQVSELIGNIYDASIDPSLWPRVLEQTCGYIQGIAAVLVAHKATAGAGEDARKLWRRHVLTAPDRRETERRIDQSFDALAWRAAA